MSVTGLVGAPDEQPAPKLAQSSAVRSITIGAFIALASWEGANEAVITAKLSLRID
jgi:hypothetical protein